MSTTQDLVFALPLNGVQLIEASAGTGKTYTLAGLYARLIVERGLSVRQILVVTYTKAATEELKARLRERLAICAEIAATPEAFRDNKTLSPAQRQCQILIDTALNNETQETLQTRLRLAALSMDEAQISTIHSFCQRALREHAFATGVDTHESELYADDRDLIEIIARDLWRECATAGDKVAYSAFSSITGDAKKFATLLPKLLESQKQLLPKPNIDIAATKKTIAEKQYAWANLKTAWHENGNAAFDALEAHHAAGHFDGNKLRIKSIISHRQTLARAFAFDVEFDIGILARYTPNELNLKRKQTGAEFPQQAFFHTLAEALRIDQVTREAHHQFGITLLHQTIAKARERLARMKRERQRLCFDDMIAYLSGTLAGSSGKALAIALHTQFPCALVDEFQDTDTRQFAIFKSIYIDHHSGTLYLIGDPKQAIYRFRGGDIQAYLTARQYADKQYSLSSNFRSTPGYLQAIEQLYTFAGTEAFLDSRIRFTSVTAGGDSNNNDFLIDGKAATPLNFLHLDDVPPIDNKENGRQRLAEGCAAAIFDLLQRAQHDRAQLVTRKTDGIRNYRRLHAGDIAVLVNKHMETEVMQTALGKLGISSVCVSKQSVFTSEEARELHLLLVALTTFDEPRLRAALTTLLFGYTLDTLAHLFATPRLWHEKIAWFSALRRTWEVYGIVAMLEQVFEFCAAHVLTLERGERRLTNWLHLADLLQKSASKNSSLQGLTDWLERRIHTADDENEDEQLRLESDANRVQILTLHKSKGLEYPIVFLPFAALRGGQSSIYPKLHRFHDEQGTACAYFVADKEAAANTGAIQAATTETMEEYAEGLRVLYVALTRARYACYVSAGVIGQSGELPALAHLLKLEKHTNKAHLSALAAATPQILVTALPASTDSRLQSTAHLNSKSTRVFPRRIEAHWRVHSFSQWHAGTTDSTTDRNDEPALPLLGEHESNSPELPLLPRGATFGNAIHEILELMEFSLWKGWRESSPPPVQGAIIERILSRHNLVADREIPQLVRKVSCLIAATLNTPLPMGIHLADLPISARRAELEFHFGIADADPIKLISLLQQYGYQSERKQFGLIQSRIQGLMHGIIDLVFVHNGRWYILDYKTNDLGNRRLDYIPKLLNAAVRSGDYDLQYLIYLTALHRWLKARLGLNYDIQRDLGGAIYLFVRGLDESGTTGVLSDNPPAELIERLDALLMPLQA